MQFKVRIFLGEDIIEPSELSKLTIHSVAVDKIVNDVVDTVNASVSSKSKINGSCTDKMACSA